MSTAYRSSCDTCGWAGGPYRTGKVADFAYRRHSCTRQAMLQAREQRVQARKTSSGTVRDCSCPKTHHEHGTYTAYVVDKCRCRPCRDAASDYERHRVKQRTYGIPAYVDASPARNHVNALRDQGMGWKRVAEAAGIETSVVWKLLYGDTTRGMAPSKRITPKTHDALLAVTLDLAPGRHVDGTGTRRRLQALVALGWSQAEIGRRLGILEGNFHKVITGTNECVTVATRDKATSLYDELWDCPAPADTKWQKIARANALNGARRHGWVPPLAWDDDTIDDPAAQPWNEPAADVTAPGGGIANHDSLTDCATWGMTTAQAADRLGIHKSTVEHALRRLGDPELTAAFARNATAHEYRDAS